jgi:hypothetical protein
MNLDKNMYELCLLRLEGRQKDVTIHDTIHYCYNLLLFSLALQPSAGYGLLVARGFVITHTDAPQSVGLLWTSDRLVTETST